MQRKIENVVERLKTDIVTNHKAQLRALRNQNFLPDSELAERKSYHEREKEIKDELLIWLMDLSENQKTISENKLKEKRQEIENSV